VVDGGRPEPFAGDRRRLLLYLPTTWLCIFWEPRLTADDPVDSSVTAGVRGPTRLPVWISLLAIANAVVVPAAISMGVAADIRTEPFATWYLGGIGALMTIVMARRRPLFAWIGTAILAALSAWWMGGLNALALGLVGSVVWVVVAQLLIRGLDRAARDTAQLAELQRVSSAWQASQLTRQRERRIQVQRAIAIAGPRPHPHRDRDRRPVLTRRGARCRRAWPKAGCATTCAGAASSTTTSAPQLERGAPTRQLRSPCSTRAASTAPTNVQLAAQIRRGARRHAARRPTSDRLYIRTSPHDARRGHRGGPLTLVRDDPDGDEDAVDLWREIDHPGR
jgi:hypothetical protein